MNLIYSATPDWQAPAERVQVTFSDAGDAVVGTTNSGAPETGTFRPAESLSAFHGQEAAGVWLLHIGDVSWLDAKCFYGAALTVTTDAVDDPVIPVVPETPVTPKTPVLAPTPPVKIETASR